MEKYVECRRGNYILRGMLHIPDGASAENKIPAVIILNGITADRDESAFSHVALSRELSEEEIASVRFDFTGNGESDGEFIDMSVLTEEADAEAMLDFVRGLDFVDKKRIAFHGMSQGGLVSCLTAVRRSEDVCCVSLWSPAFVIPDQLRSGMVLGMDISDIEEKGYLDLKGLKLGARYYREGKDIDIYEEMKDYKKPVQIVHGSQDSAVPIECSKKMKQKLGDGCTLKIVEGADHNYASIEFNEFRVKQAVAFLKKQLL